MTDRFQNIVDAYPFEIDMTTWQDYNPLSERNVSYVIDTVLRP